jgi:hypothetical protein
MGVRIDIGLDFEGNHTFAWEPTDDPRAPEVPEPLLHRWAAERRAFARANDRWQGVVAEIERVIRRAHEPESPPDPLFMHRTLSQEQ